MPTVDPTRAPDAAIASPRRPDLRHDVRPSRRRVEVPSQFVVQRTGW